MTPSWNDTLDCFGWRWKAAALLLLAGPFAALLPHPSALMLSLGLITFSALLALSASVALMRQALDPAAIPAEENDPLMSLSAVLESQHGQMHEAAAAVSRAVTAGAQLTQLTRQAEQHWRGLLDQTPSQLQPAAMSTALLEELRAAILLAREEDAAARQAAESALHRKLDELGQRIDALSAAPVPPQIEPLLPPTLTGSLQILEDVSERLAGQARQTAHQEASLGDAARYLTEIAERLRDGSQAVDTHAVRLQAMISLAGQKQEEAATRQSALLDRLQEMAPASDPVPALLHSIAAQLGRPG